MFSVKKWFFYVVITVFTATPLLANETHEKSHLAVSVKNGLVSLDTENVTLNEVLEEIGKKATPSFNVKSFITKRITASFENMPLKEAVSQLVKKNYAIAFDKQTNHLKTIFLLPEGSGTSTVILDEDREIAKIFPEPNSDDPQRINDYIKERNGCLNNIAQREPQKNIVAQVSLKEPLPATKAMSKIKDHQLAISELNHGWLNLSGGYKVDSQLSQEDMFRDFSQKHKTFLRDLIRDSNSILKESNYNADEEKSVKYLIQNAEDQLGMAEEGVIMVYGATIIGNAQSISGLAKDSKVRLIDSPECSTEIKNILKGDGYESITIFIPLKPE